MDAEMMLSASRTCVRGIVHTDRRHQNRKSKLLMSRGSVNTAIGMMDQCASFWLPCCDAVVSAEIASCPQMRLQRPADTGFADGHRLDAPAMMLG
jgi:hypothetical protein